MSERFSESVLAQLKSFSVETYFISLPGYRQSPDALTGVGAPFLDKGGERTCTGDLWLFW